MVVITEVVSSEYLINVLGSFTICMGSIRLGQLQMILHIKNAICISTICCMEENMKKFAFMTLSLLINFFCMFAFHAQIFWRLGWQDTHKTKTNKTTLQCGGVGVYFGIFVELSSSAILINSAGQVNIQLIVAFVCLHQNSVLANINSQLFRWILLRKSKINKSEIVNLKKLLPHQVK